MKSSGGYGGGYGGGRGCCGWDKIMVVQDELMMFYVQVDVWVY